MDGRARTTARVGLPLFVVLAAAALVALTVAPSLAARANDTLRFFAPCGTVTGPHWSALGKSGTKYKIVVTAKASVVHAVCVLAKAAVPLIAKETYNGHNSSIKGRYGFTDCTTLPLAGLPRAGLGQKAFAGQCIDDQEGDSFAWIGVGLHYPGLG
jgi:hypothetical protein